jgi:hypothetical protein
MKQLATIFLSLIFSILLISANLVSQTRIPRSANVRDVVGKAQARPVNVSAKTTTESTPADVAPMRSRPGPVGPLRGTPVSPAPRQVMSGSNLNVPSAYPTIQEAIAAAADGDTINVYPGTYNQDSAIGFDPSTGGAGSNNFNIFVNKSVVIRGVTALGVPVTDVNSLLAFVEAKQNVPTFGADAFFVQADNVTISGLDITGYPDTVYYNNKTVEVAGDNFTLKNCKVHGLNEAAAIYISDWHYNPVTDVSHLQSYRFQGNYIDAGGIDADGIRIASGAGWSGPVAGRVITGNTFTNAVDNIALVGPGAEAWDLYPVGAATITGNSFMNADRRHIVAWGLYNGSQGYAEPDWTNILASNTFDRGAVIWSGGTTMRSWDFPATFYYVRGIYSSIQRYAIAKAQPGDSVQVLPGTYSENITITVPLTINGAGQGSTIIYPATSDPGPSSGPSFGNCQVIVVSAHNVTISNLTIDGNNPVLTSGVIVHGADVDARNGIIEADGPWNNTVVHHTTVKNIYYRAIYARSGGSGFNFHDNIVQNVDGSPNSIAMFNSAGSGIFANNTVSQAGDAISANHSRGTQFLNNTITNSLSGVHTDNAGDGGGVADVIQGNTVANSPPGGYGVWDFVPYIAPTIRENTITNVDVGLGAFGGAFSPSPTVTTPFIRNIVNGQSKANSIGAYITNSTFYWGVTNVAVSMANNVVNNNTYGFDFESANGDTVTCSGYPNSMSGNGTAVFTDSVPAIYGGNGSAGYLAADVRGYWWGSINPPAVAGPSAGAVVYSPWLGIGTDADLVTMGFQTVSPMTWYANGSKTLQSAVDFVSAGDVLKVLPGTYTEQIEIAKALTLRNAGGANPVLQSPVTLTKYFTTSANNFPILYVHDAAPVVVRNFTVDGAGRGNGNYRFMGISFFNAGGTIDSCLVKDVRETPINGDQHGNAIYSYVNNAVPRTVNVSNCTVNGFQKNGITTNGSGMTGIITGNTVTGAGAVNYIAQNGIQLGFGATGTVSGNNVSGIAYSPGPDVACALLVYNGTDPVVTTNNIFTNSTVGIYYLNVGGTISGNNIAATALACGTPNYWGIDVDPGSAPHLTPQPFGDPVAKSSKLKSVSSPVAISTVVHHNTLTSDGTAGTGLEMDALGGQTLNVHAYRNTISQWGYGVYFYRDGDPSTLSARVDTNTIAGNVYGAFNQTGQLQNAFLNWWGNATGPRDVKTLPNVPDYNNPGGTGDSVSGYVDYNPWYLDAGKTTPSVFTLTVVATHGSVARIPDQPTYNAGTPVQITASPAVGYHFTSWSGDTVSSVNPVTIVMNADKTVTANFAINTYTITPSAGAHGSISPSAPVTVNYGSPSVFTFSPDPGYAVDSIIVDGVLQPHAVVYTFTNVTADHSVRVTFTSAPEYLKSFRSFTYEEMPVNRAIRKKPVTDYWEFKIKNTIGVPITQINILFRRPVHTILSSPNFTPSGYSQAWSFGGTLMPNDSVIISGRSYKPQSQKISRLWFDPAIIPPQMNLLPLVEHLEYPMPNLANVREDAFRRGAFSATNGLIAGIPRPDAPKLYGWVRVTTPTNLYRSFIYHGLHTGTPRGFDTFNNLRPFVKEQRTLTPLQQNNRLFADLLTLKFNIAVSARGITEPGFGELRYVQSGNPYSLMLIKEIASKADSLMTYFIINPGVYDTLDRTIQLLNTSFSGPMDTLGWWIDSLKIKGVRPLLSVPYLQVSGIPPERTSPVVNNEWMMPDKFALLQNYPNPFNPTTTISFTIASPGLVTLKVYNILGQEVQTLLQQEDMDQGFQEIEFNGDNLGTGVYFYRLTVETTDDAGVVRTYHDIRKMLLLK